MPTTTKPKICPKAKALVKASTLWSGSHKGSPPQDPSMPCPACVMELASQIEMLCKFDGAKWTDHPSSVCPVIASFCITLNDNFGDAERELLKPYALKTLNTRSTREVEEKRAFLAIDWCVRTIASGALRRAGVIDHADVLANLPEIDSKESAARAVSAARAASVASAAWADWADYADYAKLAAEIFADCLRTLDRMIEVKE